MGGTKVRVLQWGTLELTFSVTDGDDLLVMWSVGVPTNIDMTKVLAARTDPTPRVQTAGEIGIGSPLTTLDAEVGADNVHALQPGQLAIGPNFRTSVTHDGTAITAVTAWLGGC